VPAVLVKRDQRHAPYAVVLVENLWSNLKHLLISDWIHL
jgi:hypothetical protein